MKLSILILLGLGILFSACTGREKPMTVVFNNAPENQLAGEPYLFSDWEGGVYLSWIEDYDTVSHLKLSQWKDGAWNTPTTIVSGTEWFINWADYPMVVTNGGGRFMAHFLDKSGPGKFSYDVKITTSDDGTLWKTPFILHDDGKEAEHGFVSLVPYGEFVFVSWLDGRNTVSDIPDEHQGHDHHGEMSLRAAIVSYDGVKLNEWELDTRTCDCCQTSAAITDNGPVVIYRDRSETEVRDISIVRYVDNQWTDPKSIFTDNWKINGCPVNGPRCEAINNTLAIAWFTLANNTPEVKVVFSADGGETFGKPIRVSGEETIGRVDLVLLDEATAVVSWMEGSAIMVTKVYANGKYDTPVQVSESSSSRSSGFPQIARSGAAVVVAWTDDETRTIKTATLE
jgi:hypothetical protein